MVDWSLIRVSGHARRAMLRHESPTCSLLCSIMTLYRIVSWADPPVAISLRSICVMRRVDGRIGGKVEGWHLKCPSHNCRYTAAGAHVLASSTFKDVHNDTQKKTGHVCKDTGPHLHAVEPGRGP